MAMKVCAHMTESGFYKGVEVSFSDEVLATDLLGDPSSLRG
jgi:hypothetical protein